MFEIACLIGMLVVAIIVLSMFGLFVYYFHRLFNYIMYMNTNPIEELPDSINIDDLV